LIRHGALFEQAVELCAQACLAQLLSAMQLNAGKNNQTFKLNLSDGSEYIFKKYHHHQNDLRDRLGAEWRFLEYVWQLGVRQVPKPIARNTKHHVALYECVDGEKLKSDNITEDHIREAANFIISINKSPEIQNIFPKASEAAFSLHEHVSIIEKRIARFGNLDEAAPNKDEVKNFIYDELLPAWKQIRTYIMESDYYLKEKAIKPIFLSPSDFGFHNILNNESMGLKFIDFEYSGCDDLAKLTNDFMSCPEIPVPQKYRTLWIDIISNQLSVDDEFIYRVNLLNHAYQIKWVCIILNDFLFVDAQRRDFASQQSRAERCKDQLRKAQHKMNNIFSTL
jgi:hypothetical protein